MTTPPPTQPTVTLPIDDIKPYWRNPRRIPPEAIAAVRSSIERYGYQQPIVVDTEHVIVVGHTRHLALQEMGVTDVQCYVTDLPPDKAREYRVIDNRTAEMGQWDHSALVLELREFETGLLTEFFPDVDLELSILSDELVTQADVDRATSKVLDVKLDEVLTLTTVECPSCYHRFDVRTDSLPGLSRADLEALAPSPPQPQLTDADSAAG